MASADGPHEAARKPSELGSSSEDSEDDDLILDELDNAALFGDRHKESLDATRLEVFAWNLLPSKVQRFIHELTLSRFLICLLCLTLPVDILIFLAYGLTRSVIIPKQSKPLLADIANKLSGTGIPSYVLDYVLLDESEGFFPGDIQDLLQHTYPAVDFAPVSRILAHPDPLSLDNLDDLNDLGGEDTYLTSEKDLATNPQYLHGTRPDKKTLQTKNAKSCVVIINDLGDGVVHAFYLYWYTYNKGIVVKGLEFDNHLGDWEHNMIRFENGEPKSMWFSQHMGGRAFTYDAVQKLATRPLVYSAIGTHANYPIAGWQDLHNSVPELPAKIAYDHASAGPLWDPLLSAYYYTYVYDPVSGVQAFEPALNDTPVNYLYFKGKWGDQRYPDDDTRQFNFHGAVKFNNGPSGPLYKDLNRTDTCRKKGVVCKPLDEIWE